ncbi:MAG TPA: DUF4442 domain-containing protein [Thermoanaerobaculia bacterium]|nr:DUF4442 domain-containing protein [Thermoanaerobaculia bacterium]
MSDRTSDPRPSDPLPKAARRALFWINLWPPYLGAGIRVRRVPGEAAVEVTMKNRWWNGNYYGTHFGGSLYSMCDPFFTLLLFWQLGRGYNVLDQAATIEFLRPGKGTVRARFEVPPETVQEIRAQAASGEKLLPEFEARVLGPDGEVVAKVGKVVYVRKKRRVQSGE